jgi:hypothetical protein
MNSEADKATKEIDSEEVKKEVTNGEVKVNKP